MDPLATKGLNCGHAFAFGRVDEAVSGGKPPAGKGVVGLLSTFEYVLHFVRRVRATVSPNQIIIIIIVLLEYIGSNHKIMRYVLAFERK